MKVNGRRTKNQEMVIHNTIIGTYYYYNGDDYNGDIYEGEWKDDQKNGNGTLITNIGIYKFVNGNYYKGKWKDDMASGSGNCI